MNTKDSEFARIKREQKMRSVPDPIHHTDTSETLEYIQGWNDCRQAMLAEQPAQQEPMAWMYDWICEGELIEGWIAHKESEIPRSLASNIRPLYTTPQPAQRILELEALLERQTALLERQTARIVDLQTHIDNFDGEDR